MTAIPYTVGDVRSRVPCRRVTVTSPADVLAERRRFAHDHGLPEAAVWSEIVKLLPMKG